MALSLTQGAVAAALVSEGVGGGLGGQVTEPSDYVPPDVNLAPLLNQFERFVAAGGPKNLDAFITSFFDNDPSDSPARMRRGMSPGAEKRARLYSDQLSSQMKKMIAAAGEPLLYQVIILLLSNFYKFQFSE